MTSAGALSGDTRIEAPADRVAMYETEGYRGLVTTGVSHRHAARHADGDRARAIGCSFVVLRGKARWFIWRAAINEWALVPTPDGSRIAERINRTLDGSANSHDVMRQVLG